MKSLKIGKPDTTATANTRERLLYFFAIFTYPAV